MMTDTRSLVDAEHGLVSRRIFIEPEIYAQELERIFARCWLFLCHESQIGCVPPFTRGVIGHEIGLVLSRELKPFVHDHSLLLSSPPRIPEHLCGGEGGHMAV